MQYNLGKLTSASELQHARRGLEKMVFVMERKEEFCPI
ncbi:MAG: hypothetical protein GDYSWBUE_001940 [Candidatus Fervidibacterota bacterium]